MIIGIGIDILEIGRVTSWLDDERICHRFFHSEEVDYILSRGTGAPQTLAGHFAAKEAFVKALGTGFNGINLRDIRVLNTENGRPELILSGTALRNMRRIGALSTHISISHQGNLAIAQVILEK